MHVYKWISRALIVVLIVAMMPLAALAAPAAQPDRVDPVLRQALVDGGSSDLVVEFTEQADLSAAYSMDWQARGVYVVEALRAVAQQVQAEAVATLDRRGLRHRTFIAGNELYVWGADMSAALNLPPLPKVAYVRAPRTFCMGPIVAPWPTPHQGRQAPGPAATEAWGITDTKADQFWTTFGVQGSGIVVAKIDTGVQYGHPAGANQYKCAANPSSPTCCSDPSNICVGSPCDNNGHGTHLMGTMVADDNPSLTHIAGMAPNANGSPARAVRTAPAPISP